MFYNVCVILFSCFEIHCADRFSRYDYGPIMNLQHYNSTEPPTYDLRSVHVPIALVYGKNDVLANVEVMFFRKFLLNLLLVVILIRVKWGRLS